MSFSQIADRLLRLTQDPSATATDAQRTLTRLGEQAACLYFRHAARGLARFDVKCWRVELSGDEFRDAQIRYAVWEGIAREMSCKHPGRLPGLFGFGDIELEVTGRYKDGRWETLMGYFPPERWKQRLEDHIAVLWLLAELAEEIPAGGQRDFETFLDSASRETRTLSFQEWASGERVTLAIVFTDVVGSTALGQELGDEAMSEVRGAHFAQSRKFIDEHKGREIKTMGDGFMVAFHSVDQALDYARALQADTGHARVQIRAGIHIGSMQVAENDVFGGTVNFAARVVHEIDGPEIWLSDRAKEYLAENRATRHAQLKWERKDDVRMKGIAGVFTLWSMSE